MTTQIPHFIDGQRTAGQSARTADVFDPSTGAVQAVVPMAGKADVDAAVATAVEAQKGWAAWNPYWYAPLAYTYDYPDYSSDWSNNPPPYRPDAAPSTQGSQEQGSAAGWIAPSSDNSWALDSSM